MSWCITPLQSCDAFVTHVTSQHHPMVSSLLVSFCNCCTSLEAPDSTICIYKALYAVLPLDPSHHPSSSSESSSESSTSRSSILTELDVTMGASLGLRGLMGFFGSCFFCMPLLVSHAHSVFHFSMASSWSSFIFFHFTSKSSFSTLLSTRATFC
jgi:hypothetical protein